MSSCTTGGFSIKAQVHEVSLCTKINTKERRNKEKEASKEALSD
jgi:hypothetical protein